MRHFRTFSWKDTNLRVCCDAFDLVTSEIVAQRRLLEAYIKTHSAFQSSFVPVSLLDHAPLVAKKMDAASRLTGLGPMASVAGVLAQMGVMRAVEAGCSDAIVENGGDIYLHATEPVIVGIYAGTSGIAGHLAFSIQPADMPVAMCASSSRMGHSASLGNCDLACVLASDGALADSAATWVANLIHCEEDVQRALDTVIATPGIRGILAAKGNHVGLVGELPTLLRNVDLQMDMRITVDKRRALL